MAPSVDIPLSVRIMLAHAAVQATAESANVDALLIKGHAVESGLYSSGRMSMDVDILVRPSHLDRFIASLQSRGWRKVVSFRHGSIFRHAQTMRHAMWGLADVHRFFPGFEHDAELTFDALWADRTTKNIAGYPCTVASPQDQSLIIAVHAAREGGFRNGDMIHLNEVLGEQEWNALHRRARELGAFVALAAAQGQLGAYKNHPAHDLWEVLSVGGNHAQQWRARLRSTQRWRDRVTMVSTAPIARAIHLRMKLKRTPRGDSQGHGERTEAPGADALRGAPQNTRTPNNHTRPHTPSAVSESSEVLKLFPAPDVAFTHDFPPGDCEAQLTPIYLAKVPDGSPQLLTGSAALIWRCAINTPRADVASIVMECIGYKKEDIRDSIEGFVDQLRSQEFLIEAPETWSSA